MISWAILFEEGRMPMKTGRPKVPLMLSKEEHQQFVVCKDF